jgi:hypothetical protein
LCEHCWMKVWAYLPARYVQSRLPINTEE